MMRRQSKRVLMVFLMTIMVFITACGQNDAQAGPNSNPEQIRPFQMNKTNSPQKLNGGQENQAVIQLVDREGEQYISLDELVNVLQYNLGWDEETKTHTIGDTDVVYEIKANSTHVEKEENDINLEHGPITLEGSTYIPKEAFIKLFQEDMKYEFQDHQLIIYPSENTVNPNDVFNEEEDDNTNDELNFEDDPEDPPQPDEAAWNVYPDEEDSIAVLKKANRHKVIRTARNYLGVKYKFGAKPYATSRKFDCSSYTKHVFNKYGVKLNRISRNQAKQGRAVSRKHLRIGDLLFFYIPGRFKSNKTIGHVGIYMGKGKMIHSGTEPKNGVQITSINKAYWKRTFIKARRVISG
jgi:cell wall-associated NlpC family hydrolase